MSTDNQSRKGSIEKSNEHTEAIENARMEASSKGKVIGSIPIKYFLSGGHWSVLSILLASFLVTQFLASSADYWASVW